MLELLLGWLDALAGWSVISAPAKRLAQWIRRRKGGAVTGGGVEFFPDRDTLIRAYGTLGSRLKEASTVSGMWVVGQKFFSARDNLHVLKRLLLPHPEGDALKQYSLVSKHDEVIRYIYDATRHAQANGTKVKWYQPFVFSSLLLVDTDKPEGWAHIEIVLPYSEPEKRPSFTIYKRQSEGHLEKWLLVATCASLSLAMR